MMMATLNQKEQTCTKTRYLERLCDLQSILFLSSMVMKQNVNNQEKSLLHNCVITINNREQHGLLK